MNHRVFRRWKLWVKNKSRRKKQRRSLLKPKRRRRLPKWRKNNKINDPQPHDDLTQLQEAASQGEPEALFALGVRHEQGHGLPVNLRQAARNYRKAAEGHHLGGQLAMARLCLLGKGVQQDAAEAAEWYRMAAEQGHAEAQYNMAEMYAAGRGVEQNDQSAAFWYQKAAESGLLDAQIKLARLYTLGKGVTADNDCAEQWLERAQKLMDSRRNLADNHSQTISVCKDAESAEPDGTVG